MMPFAEKMQRIVVEDLKKLEKLRKGYGFGDLVADWAKWRKGKWPFRDMTQEELDRSVDPIGGVLKPMALAKLLKYAPQRIGRNLSLTERKHLVELLKVPSRELVGTPNMLWKRLPSTTAGQRNVLTGEISLNPTKFMPFTARHEATHARQWTPRAEGEEISHTTLMRGLRDSLFVTDRWEYLLDPVEIHAKLVEKNLAKGMPFSDAFRLSMKKPSIYEPTVLTLSRRFGKKKGEAIWNALTDFAREAGSTQKVPKQLESTYFVRGLLEKVFKK